MRLDWFQRLAVLLAAASLPHPNALTLSSGRTRPARQAPTSRVVYIKTHATGSSTLTNIFHRFCDSYNFSCYAPPPPYFAGKNMYREDLEDVLQMKKEQNLSWDIWPNHAYLETDLFDQIIPNNTKVSIFRNPLDRLTSSWGHGRWQLQQALDGLRKNEMPEYPCGPEGKKMSDHVRIEDFEALDFVILTEHMNLGLVMMRRKLNWQLADIIYASLKTSDAGASLKAELHDMLTVPAERMTNATLEMLHYCVLGDESQIYTLAADKFYQQWADLGKEGQADVQRELEVFEDMLAEVQACCSELPTDGYCKELLADNLEWNGQHGRVQSSVSDLGCRAIVSRGRPVQRTKPAV